MIACKVIIELVAANKGTDINGEKGAFIRLGAKESLTEQMTVNLRP